MAANVLGRAYIEVHADTRPFGKEMLAEAAAISKLAEAEAKKSGTRIGRNLGDGIERESRSIGPRIASSFFGFFERHFTRIGRRRSLLGSLAPSLTTSAAKVGISVGTEMGTSMASSVAKGFVGGMGAISDAVSGFVRSIGSSVGNVGSNGPFALILGGLIIAGIPAIIGAVIALASALSGLLYIVLLLPGAIAGLVAAIAPIVVAFNGFGEAVSAVLSKDPKKIAAAFKDLAPAARTVARQVAPLVQMFKGLSKIAQQNFFARLIGTFPKLTAALAPIFNRGFATAAAAAGQFAASLISLGTNPQVQKFFSASFTFASDLFKVLGPPMLNFITSLAALSTATFPTLLKLFGMFGGVLNKFAEWIQRSIKNGDFDRFMDKMLLALDNVDRLLKSGWNLIKALLGGPDQQQDAQQFFDQLIATLDGLTTFFRSPDGQKSITGLITLAKTFLFALLLVGLALFEIVAALQLVYEWMGKVISLLPGFSHVGDTVSVRQLTRQTVGSAPGILRAPGHADGGIFGQEHLAMIAEGNRKEVILPLTDPARARDIANRAGLSSMLGSDTQVNVYIGDEQVMARVEKRVGSAFKQFGRQMKYGPRTVGVGA